jgi:RNA polymerase sigma-70 factor (ECF subfamily)
LQGLTDNKLMLKVKSGDLDKLGLLYERHRHRLFGFFFKKNGNVSISEDLVQNVFIRILEYKHTFSGNGSFTAWMFHVAKNVSYDYFKKNERNNNQTDLAILKNTLCDGDDISLKMDQKEKISQLEKALLKLPKKKREIIILSKYKKYKFSEIGEILGCSEGAAKVKSFRALNDLRIIYLKMETH